MYRRDVYRSVNCCAMPMGYLRINTTDQIAFGSDRTSPKWRAPGGCAYYLSPSLALIYIYFRNLPPPRPRLVATDANVLMTSVRPYASQPLSFRKPFAMVLIFASCTKLYPLTSVSHATRDDRYQIYSHFKHGSPTSPQYQLQQTSKSFILRGRQ